VAFAKSPHAAEAVRCVSCHGGDDRALDAARAHGVGFRGRVARSDVPRLCASCHADENQMRPYNIPVDQWALYQTSGHGKALARGNTKVAVCTDCHGVHDILAKADPASRVYRLNSPRTCGSCHGDSTRMAGTPQYLTYPAYMTSVHARELLERGNPNAPTCVDCHGVHGAAPPNVGDVSKVCGHCHGVERRYFGAGPHLQKMQAQDLPECATCHDNHATQASDPSRLATQCAECHGEDSMQKQLGASMWSEYEAAARALDVAAARVARAERIPIPTADYQARLEQGRTYLREAMPAAHSVRADLVSSFTVRSRSVAEEIREEIDRKLSEMRWRYVGLLLFWFYIGMTIVLLRQFRERPKRSSR
jgi:hypothetical protein